MKLTLIRDQSAKTGLLGGHKGMRFKLDAQLVLTPGEQELVKQYRMENTLLCSNDENSKSDLPIFLDTLTSGTSLEMDSVVRLLRKEAEIKDGCERFKTLLAVMASFGGQQVFEF